MKRKNIMKKLLLIAAFSSIYFIFGCSDTNQLAGPDNTVNVIEQSSSISSVNWISLPQPNNKSLQKRFSKGKFIKLAGGRGNNIHIKEQYEGGPFGVVKIDVKISFERDSFNEEFSFYEGEDYLFNNDGKELWFTLLVDDETCTSTFTPHIMFDKPVELDLKFEGVDFHGMDPDKIQFVFMPEGSEQAFVPVYRKLLIDPEKGKLQVWDAQIPHFSRYGYAH